MLAEAELVRRGGVRLRPPDRGAARGPRLPGRVGARRPAASSCTPRRRSRTSSAPPWPGMLGARRAPGAGGRAGRRRRLRPEVRRRARGGARVRRRPCGRRAGQVGRGPRREPARRLPGPRAALRRARRLRRRRPHAGRRRRHRGRRRRLLDAPVHLRRRAADGGDRDARPLPRASTTAAAPARSPPTRRRWRPTAASRARRWCWRWSGCCRRPRASSSSRSTRSACATWPASSRTSARPA